MDTQAREPDTTPSSAWARLRSRPATLAGLVVAAVGVVVFVLVWFQPQALLFDDVVDEAFPEVGSAPEPAPEPAVDAEVAGDAGATDDDAPAVEPGAADDDMAAVPEPPTGPVALSSGSFTSRNRYTVTGTATVYELEDRSRLLRLEDFESTNGPDLFVYLAAADSAQDDAALDADVVNLGVLTGNVGAQNYVIPDDVDLERYDTVVIWCLRFSTGFGAADLMPT